MAYTNAVLSFNSTSGLSYTDNNQLAHANKISTTLTASSSGITLDHTGQSIVLNGAGLYMTSLSIKASGVGFYPLFLPDSAGTQISYITDTGILWCQGLE